MARVKPLTKKSDEKSGPSKIEDGRRAQIFKVRAACLLSRTLSSKPKRQKLEGFAGLTM